MIKPTLLCTALVLLVSTTFASECEDSYQNASYGLIHVKKALDANNSTHLKEFALRSKIALEKVQAATEKCGCVDANYASYDAIENLEKALEKEKFEDIRFRVSKAKAFAKATLVALDVCNAKRSFLDYDNEEENLIELEEQLLAQQQQLLVQQQQLAAQIEEQKLLQKKVQKDRELMLTAQKKLQITAEANLEEMELLIIKFTEAMGCLETTPLTKESFKRNTQDLSLESLGRTKAFYIEKAQEMANTLVNRLSKCDIDE
ncbi:MAG: hypothetical protein ABJM06_12805 [Gilvibacter sp.]